MRLPSSGEPALLQDVRARLRTSRFGRSLRGYANVGSTNTLAAEWADEGAPEGAVVYAEYQTAGRGRFGRVWSAQGGLNLTFSIVLRPDLPSERLGLVTIAAGTSVAFALDEVLSPARATIKWPNDVHVNGRKCCGMLLESFGHSRAGRRATVILGIGINLNQVDFSSELQPTATSIKLETGRTVPRADLMASLLEHLERRYEQIFSDAAGLRRAYEARLHFRGERIELRPSNGSAAVAGVICGIDETGGLVLDSDGRQRVFHAGEVTMSPVEAN